MLLAEHIGLSEVHILPTGLDKSCQANIVGTIIFYFLHHLHLSSLCKRYIYQDMLEKPSELVLFRKVEQGGLGLHNTKYKALASLISTFLQTAANKNFRQSLNHSCLYRYYCLGDDSLRSP